VNLDKLAEERSNALLALHRRKKSVLWRGGFPRRRDGCGDRYF